MKEAGNRSFSLSRNEKINWKPSSGRSQENEMLQKTNIQTICPSLRSLWPTVSELFAETFHATL